MHEVTRSTVRSEGYQQNGECFGTAELKAIGRGMMNHDTKDEDNYSLHSWRCWRMINQDVIISIGEPELWAILDGYCVNAVSVLCLVPEVLPAARLCERMVHGRWLSGLVRAQYSVKLLALCRPPTISKSGFYHHKLNARLMQLADLCCLLLWVGARLAFGHAYVVGFG